jgi:hypothetical protein
MRHFGPCAGHKGWIGMAGRSPFSRWIVLDLETWD